MSEYSNCVGYDVLRNQHHRTRCLRSYKFHAKSECSPHFKEPEGRLRTSKQPAKSPYPAPHVTHRIYSRPALILSLYTYGMFSLSCFTLLPYTCHKSLPSYPLRLIDWKMVTGFSQELSTSIFRVYAVTTNTASHLTRLESSSIFAANNSATASSGRRYCFLEKRRLAAAALCPWF